MSDSSLAITLVTLSCQVWSTCLELPAAQSISYKYFVARRGGEDAEEELFWEPGKIHLVWNPVADANQGDDRETRINEVQRIRTFATI